jgi:hypothetical protein
MVSAVNQAFSSILAGHAELQCNVEDNGDVLRPELHFHVNQQTKRKRTQSKRQINRTEIER